LGGLGTGRWKRGLVPEYAELIGALQRMREKQAERLKIWKTLSSLIEKTCENRL